MGAARNFFRAKAGGRAPPLRVTRNVIVIGRGDEGIALYERLWGNRGIRDYHTRLYTSFALQLNGRDASRIPAA